MTNIQTIEMEPKRAVCMSHRGPYYMIGATFGKFAQWAEQSGVNHGDGIALYYDDPGTTAPDELRSDAGAFVSADFSTDETSVPVVDIPGGKYAVYTYVGPYDGITDAWQEFMAKWFPGSGLEMAEGVPVEVYKSDMSVTAPQDLVTELYLKVR